MNSNIKSFATIAVSLAIGAVASFLVFHSSEKDADSADVEKPISSVVKTSRVANVRKITEISLVENHGKKSVRIVEADEVKPTMAAARTEDDVEEEDLTEAQKGVLAELQKALDDNDLRKVRKALSKFVAKVENGGLAGDVPKCMRMKAVEALSWFGKDSAIDLMEYMADADAEVASDAANGFEMALRDNDMSDYARADIVKSAMQAINDREQIDSLLSQLNDMRNSVKVATITEILSSGTENARTLMQEQLGDYTDSEVATLDDLKKWAVENPDDEGDAEFYGGAAANM